MRLVCLRCIFLIAFAANAQPITGDGHLGELVVSTPAVQLNRYLRLEQNAALGSTTLSVTGDLVSAGDLLMLITMKDDGLVADSMGGTLELSAQHVGRYAWARVESVAGTQLTLASPLIRAFAAQGTQIVITPEYTTLRVLDGGSLTAAPWDGYVGGIVSLLAQNEVMNEGVIQVDGRGFRGGVAMPYQTGNPDGGECHGLVEPFPLGSMVGEGLGTAFGTQFGRGPSVLGGGAGGCVFGGGAGGAFIGQGGRGGDSRPGFENGGFGPAAVRVAPTMQLIFGGGGGAGWSQTSYVLASIGGGRGGGAILVHAPRISGAGLWRANGASPVDFGGGDWGYGGGGAGGAIVLRAHDSIQCGASLASGGRGGRWPNSKGPGGGGGGGLVFLESAGDIDCPASAVAGLAGVLVHGAQPEAATAPQYAGQVSVAVPTPVDAGLGPRFLSSPNTSVFCGTPYRYSAEHTPQLSTSGPFAFSLKPIGEAVLPKTLSVDESTGEIHWRPSSSEVGAHGFELVAFSEIGVATQSVFVSVECDAPTKVSVGCTCESTSPTVVPLLLLGWHLLRRRRTP